MKNTKALITVGVSVAVGLGAVFAAARWLANQTAIASVKVVVAAKDIEVGTRLTPASVQLADWPASSAVKGSFSNLKDIDTRVVNTNLLRGEPVVETKLAPVGTKGGLSAVISDGKRAMTVKVNEVMGVAGFALPGNYVDIMVNAPDEKNRMVSKIVLEHILVLAVAQEQSVKDDTRAKLVNAVTLEVKPEDAEKLDLARSIGNLSLVLRNQVDDKPIVTQGARPDDLITQGTRKQAAATEAIVAKAPAAVKPARVVRAANPVQTKQPEVEIIRGTTRANAADAARPQ
ncbi:MAG: Flp pilus assembly protein CpaB [Burkholderiales bacterium]|nr:Flp pilus assembly protein CpaB [Burkholderiales bacterium]